MTVNLTTRAEESRAPVLLGAGGRLGRMIRAFWPRPDLQPVGRQAGAGMAGCDILRDADGVRDTLDHAGAVICMAGVTGGAAPLSDNVDLALRTIEGAHDAGAGRVFLASSAAVYGRQDGALSEDVSPEPVSEYGRAKVEMEKAGLALGAALGQPVTVLRIGNVAGADAILGGWRADMRLDQFEDGQTPRRSYIGPATLAVVIATLAQADDLPPILNLAQPGKIAMGALLDAAELGWLPQRAPETAIAEVVLCTKLLAQHVALEDATPAELVAQWRRFKDRGL